LAHELGHVLGLSHVAARASLMCDPATSISASVPLLSVPERARAMSSSCVGGGGFAGPVPPRTIPDRTIPDRRLPIFDTPRRGGLLDDLD
jgi:hypothetical protein